MASRFGTYHRWHDQEVHRSIGEDPDRSDEEGQEEVMGLTSDREDPRLGHGVDTSPIEQHDTYLVLSPEELAQGFVRPVRRNYVHVGAPGPRYELRDLTDEEHERFDKYEYVSYEAYPADSGVTGRYWTQKQLDNIGKGCHALTSMNQTIAETYAANPSFYGATYCVGCQMHRPVGEQGEFVWDGTEERVGT